MFSKHRPTLISPQLSYILITSCIQDFRDYVQSALLYGLREYCMWRNKELTPKSEDVKPITQWKHMPNMIG